MSKRIGFVQVTIEPWTIQDSIDILRVRVEVNGREYKHSHPLSPDDINSTLDRILDEAKAQLREVINDEVARLEQAAGYLVGDGE